MKNLFAAVNIVVGLVALFLGLVALYSVSRSWAFAANGSVALVTALGCLWLAKQTWSSAE